jgi:hypothetical protein
MRRIRFGACILDNRPGSSHKMKERLLFHWTTSVVTVLHGGWVRAEGMTEGMCWRGVGGRSSRLGKGRPLLREVRWVCRHGRNQRVEWWTAWHNGRRWDIHRNRHDGGPRRSFPVGSRPAGGYKIVSDVSKNIVDNRKLLVQIGYTPNIAQ